MTDPHNEFFIEKDQLPVEVILVTGEELRGALFVQQSWRRPSIEFDAPALLNLPDPYFPLQLSDGTTRLIAKGHVVLIRGHAGESRDMVGDPAPVAIRCSNGVVARGKLMLTRVTSNVRVLDYLNRAADEFIALHEGETVVLVNRRHVVLVQDEANGAA
jgi:hypothetical protein